MNLKTWAGRVLHTVEQDGQSVGRVRLLTADGMIWHTWETPFPSAEEWAAEAEAMLDELAREWAPRRHSIVFHAEDRSGGIVSSCPKTITGSNRAAGDAATAERALADSMSAVAKTADLMLNSANVQIATLQKTVETLGQKHAEAMQMIIALQEQCTLLTKADREADLGNSIVQAVDKIPAVLEALQEQRSRAIQRRQRATNGQRTEDKTP